LACLTMVIGAVSVSTKIENNSDPS